MDTTEKVKVEDVEYHVKSPAYYRCSNCAHEENKKCGAKPGNKNVRLNKKRNHCKQFQFDEEKYKAAELKAKPIPIMRRPDWYWMTKKQRKRLAELLESALVAPAAPHLQPTDRNIITPRGSDKLIWTPGDDVNEA